MSMNDIVKTLQSAVNSQANKAQPTAYDTPAEVRRIEGNTVWVHIPGGVDETPVEQTISCSVGDTVQVRVSGGNAWLQGNQTAPPTDDTLAKKADDKAGEAIDSATMARSAAQIAEASAASAQSAAASAQADAAIAKATTDEINNYAASVSKTVTQVLADGETAGAAAQAATEAADSALYGLSTVEDVVGVLNWITAHGTMTLTSDVTVNPAHVYFVVDAGGDYVVGGTHYSIVSEPKDAELSTYYELTVDESVQNYVATHIVVDSEGLWIVPDSGGNKVLIATGAGSSYTTAGTYIVGKVGGVDTVLAEFTKDGQTIGIDDGTQNYLFADYHSLRLIDKEGKYYVYLSDLRDSSGTAQLIEHFDGDGSTKTFSLSFNCVSVDTVKVNGTTTTAYTVSGEDVTFTTAPTSGAYIEIIYNSDTSEAKAFTFGTRDTGYVGVMSFVDGLDNIAEGYCAHASGNMVYANGHYSKAGGVYSEANNTGSNAQGLYVIANAKWQTVIGRYNDTQADTLFEIGNGTADNARSNAFTVDKNGGVVAGALIESSGTYTGGYNDEALMTLATRNKWHTILGEATE